VPREEPTVERLSECNDPEFWELLFFRLSVEHNSVVRQAIASNPETPLVALETFAEDPDPLVRGALIRNYNTPENLLLKLINRDYDDDFIPDWERCLMRRADISASLLSRIRELDEDLEHYIATDASTPPCILEEIILYTYSDDCRDAASENANVTPELLWKLKDTHEAVILKHPKSPSDLLQYIAEMVEVREGIIDMWHTGEIECIVSHPNAPQNFLLYALESRDEYVASLISANEAISEEIRDKARKICE
jgi:hypothetical protein